MTVGAGAADAFGRRYAQALRPALEQRRRRARQWLRAFWAGIALLVACATVFLLWESFSPWWLCAPALVALALGMVAFGEIAALQGQFRREVSGPLYADAFPQARHDPDGRIDEATLDRAGLFPRLLGLQRREFDDRLDLELDHWPLSICSGGVWRIVEREDNKPDETLFVGTLFALQRPLSLAAPVVIAHVDVAEPPVPPDLPLDRRRPVAFGHPLLDRMLLAWAATPADLRTALPDTALQALAAFVECRPGPWRVVIDREGIIGGLDGPLLARRVHPAAPLPSPDAVIAELDRIRATLALLGALTESPPAR